MVRVVRLANGDHDPDLMHRSGTEAEVDPDQTERVSGLVAELSVFLYTIKYLLRSSSFKVVRFSLTC